MTTTMNFNEQNKVTVVVTLRYINVKLIVILVVMFVLIYKVANCS